MKLFLKLLMAMKLDVTSNDSKQINLLIDEQSKNNIFFDQEIDLYFKTDLSEKQTLNQYIEANWRTILIENLSEYHGGIDVITKTDYQLVNYENFKLTVKFSNKLGENLLDDTLVKDFDVFLYNYDALEVIKTHIENNFVVTPDILNYKHSHLMEFLEKNYARDFNRICNKHLLLNDETEFFDYLSVEEVTDKGVRLEFLSDSSFEINVAKQ
ncbi:hypothetical protein SCLARK_00578 [Spiroplasma clarkii]|uniref:Uncharacterized protein n=1 Tax=Spiroplasma clarkii TaxID=2139 RepID=A0A1Y0L0I2_9MOLU|nr:hypothetical protein [Spiroplasma clarkii]ARU91255.1 hypothetical protein SCLARK_00578 [Spiroplasma clarkii]ATX70690.1 hypothetical protein SCLAR_v1c03600 [Spiroplasma clarkii]